ncbi:hypothetical protein FRAHR75_1500012 [Frankia sp. Hr75.2]|nr:hypothetical protein FRAHR75_1500012 [Frankia sp. Hr75.2]
MINSSSSWQTEMSPPGMQEILTHLAVLRAILFDILDWQFFGSRAKEIN